MEKDIREMRTYREAEALYRAVHRPGAGLISDAAEISTNGVQAAFTGALLEDLKGAAPTRVCLTDLATGTTRVLTFGPNMDRLPKFSPDGRQLAFLSDRQKAGDFQLYLLDPVTGAARATPAVGGWVEYLHWSPDGKRILLGVAGHGADISGGQGAVSSKQINEDLPSWMPAVETGDESYRWRRAWVYEIATDRVRQVGVADSNIWESVWCGEEAIAAVTSPSPGEGSWYTASLHVVDLATGQSREVYRPRDQLGWPAASPSGAQLAIVEAVCSDRWIVAGELHLIDTKSGAARRVDTRGIDITYTEWCSETTLLLAGHRGFDTVVATCDAASSTFTETWVSQDITTGGRYIKVSGMNEDGDCALLGESFVQAPEIALIQNGRYTRVKSLDVGYADHITAIAAVETVSWRAPDGLDIQGWLLLPNRKGPHPLIMNIHGGPVWHWRPVWLGRAGLHTLLWLKAGYAVFLPNPRGSSGRGQDFARKVKGDMNGAETLDFLSGLDRLVQRGIADANRIGVTGGSYGGNMTAWLITQDARFAAAVAAMPHTNQVSAHLLSNISHFVALFLADTYTTPGGKYFQRSPIMHAHKTKTPTLNICGALDRCTPPEEAAQFHNALLENGVRSVLVTYPEEGHGIRKLPAMIDYAARLVDWFKEHMPV